MLTKIIAVTNCLVTSIVYRRKHKVFNLYCFSSVRMVSEEKAGISRTEGIQPDETPDNGGKLVMFRNVMNSRSWF